MKRRAISIVKFIIPLSFGLFLVWYLIKDLTDDDKKNIFIALERAEYRWIILSLVLGIISHISRAVRWKILIKPLGYNPKFSNTFFAIMIGYISTLVLHRVGEVIKCGVLTRYEKIPLNKLIGTVITERVFDMICLVIFGLVTLFTQFKVLRKFYIEEFYTPLVLLTQRNLTISLIVILLFIILIITGLVIFVSHRKDENSLFNKLYHLLIGLWLGIKTIKRISNIWGFIFHTVLIWSMYFFMIYFCLFCFTETKSLSILAAISVFVFGSIGVIIVQGGIGAYQIIVMKTLMEYGIPKAIGFSFGWLVWSAQVFLLIVLGLISFILLPLFNKLPVNGQNEQNKG